MNFEDTDFRQEILDIENPFDVQLVSDFLRNLDFDFKPEEVDTTMILYNLNDEIIGTGSFQRKTLKYVAVAPAFRESTAFPQIVTTLSNKILEIHKQCFVFTKPETAKLFESLGFSLIAKAEPLFSVLEFGYESIQDFQKYLSDNKVDTKTDNISAVVVNCNPFTKGHEYLITKASKESELVYLFVVKEDLSVFPFKTRWKMIEKGISHLKNVKMLSSGPYIVSGAIFPNYFLKNESVNDISRKQAEIDVTVFAKYVVPVLGIKKRYIGTENYCKTTAAYNKAMHAILPNFGVEMIEINRISSGGSTNYISASKVREAIKYDNLKKAADFIPESVKDFLNSEEFIHIQEKIKVGNNRH